MQKKKRGINSFGGEQTVPKSSNYEIRQQEINRYAGQLANSLATVSKSPGPNPSGRTTSGRTYNQQYKTNVSMNVNKAAYAGYVGGGMAGNGSQTSLNGVGAQRSNSSKQFYEENVTPIHHHGMSDPRMMSGGAMTTMAQRPGGSGRSGASIVGILKNTQIKPKK
jgi:hypothetical protein